MEFESIGNLYLYIKKTGQFSNVRQIKNPIKCACD
jgi:hypothetical protein